MNEGVFIGVKAQVEKSVKNDRISNFFVFYFLKNSTMYVFMLFLKLPCKFT